MNTRRRIAVVIAAALLPVAGHAQQLAGIVRDSAGRPIADAHVTISGMNGEWSANAQGRFVVRGIAPGIRVVEVRALGENPERRIIEFAANDSAYLDVSMTRLITKLNTVTVSERQHYNARKDEIQQRARAGFGYRADSTDFARVMSIGQALNFPGVHVTTSGPFWGIYMTGVYSITSKDGTGMTMTCKPTPWIDGQPTDWLMVNELHKEEIAAVEIYNSAARAPLQFTGTRTNCGVVLIWRKEYVNPPGAEQ